MKAEQECTMPSQRSEQEYACSSETANARRHPARPAVLSRRVGEKTRCWQITWETIRCECQRNARFAC